MVYRVYIVDDDRFLLQLYAIKFKNAGHNVQLLGGGEALLTELRKPDAVAPNIILLDVIMPGMTGFETLETIRKEGLAKSSKIVFLTNQGQDSDIEKAKEFAADGYIIKASAIPSEVFAETIKIIESGNSAQ